ncbi:pleckstrin homology domain-containing family M member 2 isoform X2 [Salvelinus fontinalis]|uniref:pleckstrin homology domain-containing family M member 2 isoform X2 n=1 Tax=Salvelinus fontinalis TaxID=8038 RepID=UPI00248568B9|nr:pleckstrin homology domain-containing family M member 2 isoform X2 [Salvelinus fontinalis]
MDQLKVKDRILENISLSVKKLQSYFAACEDETPAIRNHDRVLQRLCEHLDHALLYGLQDISSGYWVLVLHFTRREAVRQIDELQRIATNLGRSRAWLYLALSESSLESYLRLFQENEGLLQKYYFKNALVCSHDHLTLFLTLVSGLEFIRFDLELDVPYLDVAPYMPEYYKPQNLLDFEERLPSSDSLSLHSFTSTNLEWDDSAIAPSSEDYDFGDIFPVLQPSADWEEGDLTDPVSCPRSNASDPQTVFSDSVILRAAAAGITVRGTPPPRSPTFRHNPFNEYSDTNTSADITPVHTASCHHDTRDDMESTSNELEVIRMARRRKPSKKRCSVKSSTVSGDQNNVAFAQAEADDRAPAGCEGPEGDTWSPSVGLPQGSGAETVRRSSRRETGEEEESEGLLRLPEMTDTSMDSVGQPLRDVMDRLNGALDGGKTWGRPAEEEEEGEKTQQSSLPKRPSPASLEASPQPPGQQPFRGDSMGEPPNPEARVPPLLRPALAPSPNFLQAPPAPADFYCFTPHSPDAAALRSGHHDTVGHGQSQALLGGHEVEAEAPPGQDPSLEEEECDEEEKDEAVMVENGLAAGETEEETEEDRLRPTENSHPAEFKVDNNHLLLLMIHVFRENEEQLFKMVRMSTGHMEGNLQPLYLLLTDCYIYLLRKGAAEKPYTVEDAISYNELDFVSVGLDQQTFLLVCTNRRRQFLLDTADSSLTVCFLAALTSAMIKGCREPPYPSVLTDATMEKLALTKFVSQESHCEVSQVLIRLYSLVHWEDPMDVTLATQTALVGAGDSSSTKEGPLLYRACTTYLGKELWKSCYLVLSKGVLYQYTEKTDGTPLMSITMGGEYCGGCRRSNSTEQPHAFQVILTERPPLELSADNEGDVADWMLVLCQSVSKGVIPQGVAPTPCIPCCLVVTNRKLLTCHQDCQTSFFRSLGGADLSDVTAVSLEDDKEYCVVEFAVDRAQFLPPWVLYFSGCGERDRLLEALESAWRDIFQVCLPRRRVSEPLVQKRCGEALALMRSAWQRSDSLARGRAQREPWC